MQNVKNTINYLKRGKERLTKTEITAKEENDTVTDPSKLPGVTHKAALKSGSFWLLVIGMLCSVTACSAIISYAAAYWQGLGMSATASSNWTAVYLLISSLSLLIAGAVFKKLKSSG